MPQVSISWGAESTLPGPRIPWITSHIHGTPEPPPPYRTERVFSRLRFQNPTVITHAPGSDRLFVAEQRGKIYSFLNDPAVEKAELFIDLPQEITTLPPDGPAGSVGDVYGLAFHPEFERNRYCYICYTVNPRKGGEPLADGTRVSRFTVTRSDPPRVDPASETIIITWLAGGHNGGCLKFGRDGYLYISTGDAASPSPPDPLLAGQDVSNLLSAILRIDVDRTENGRNYAVPKDNPFVDLEGARGEIWAYGFRNPWKMSFDRVTGELFAGDVGWELWEMVYRIERGGNYGWSIMEGPQPVRTELPPGPTPIRPPLIALPHSKAASVTGGFVYRGERLPELVGAYVFGDWETRRMWAARFHENGDLASLDELVAPTLRIVAFGEDRAGELYIVDYDDGTIHQLAVNEQRSRRSNFPTKLSETGLFASTAEHRPAPGVVPFAINAPMWADYATAERFIALPGTSSVIVHEKNVPVPGTIFQRRLEFPAGAVLAKTISLELTRGDPGSRRRLETQILHYDGRLWHGYTYRWNDEQTDAELVPTEGVDQTFTVVDPDAPGGKRNQTWHFAGRAECARCHNPWAQHTLAFNLPQLDRPGTDSAAQSQLDVLEHLGVLVWRDDQKHSPPSLVSLEDETADLDRRARSYLQANCAHCHQSGAGGTAEIDLRHELSLQQTKTLGVRPLQGTFEIADAAIIAPGDPYRSVLFYRMAKLGRGRMPHIGSECLDKHGLRLIGDWIRQLGDATEPKHTRPISSADETDSAKRAEQIESLLSSTSGALRLARAVAREELPAAIRQQVIAAAVERSEPQIRDLFEPFVPEDQRAKRLGSIVRPEAILAMSGDAARGRDLFLNTADVQCKTCHRIGDTGGQVGPDLARIGQKLSRAQLLESILDPSRTIDPQYVSYLVETRQGRVHTGLLVEKTDRAVVLRDGQGKDVRIPRDEVEQLVPQHRSLMPELLFRDMTAQQLADLLEYLRSLR